jgi:glycosyltransferase involved in cell wall biosynthesis
MRTGALTGLVVAIRNIFARRQLLLEIHNFEFGHSVIDLVYKYIFSRCSYIITISEHTKKNWVKHGVSASKIIVLPSGIDPSFYKDIKESRSTLRENLHLSQTKKIIIYFGHLYRNRGIEDIIDSTSKLPQDEFHFIIAGGHPQDTAHYNHFIKNKYPNIKNIQLTGHLPQPRIAQLIKASDLILITYSISCPTQKSMSPLKLFEAMASEVPIVCADLPALQKLVNDSMVTFYETDNSSSLAQKISLSFQDKNGSFQKAKIAYKEVMQYDWQTRAQKIIAHLNNDYA